MLQLPFQQRQHYLHAGLCGDLVGHHLALLQMGRLVNGIRQGKAVVYTTDKAALMALASGLAALMPK